MTAAVGMNGLQPGDPAPDFALAAGDDRTLRLADYAGRKLVLYFYPKDDTPGCTKEAQGFTAALPAFAATNASVLGVSRDSAPSHAKFRSKHAIAFDLGADVEGETVQAYGAWVEKSMYGRKYMGIDRSTFLIAPDGRIAALWRSVKVNGHVEAVLKAAQAM